MRIYRDLFVILGNRFKKITGIFQGEKVGLYLINRPEWVLTDLASLAYGFVTVPLYDTLGWSNYSLFLSFFMEGLFVLFVLLFGIEFGFP